MAKKAPTEDAAGELSGRRLHGLTAPAMPLFATDLEIGAIVLGKARAEWFAKIAHKLEAKGLPPPCELHGGRYLPAVLKWYDARYGMDIVRLPSRGEAKPWRSTAAARPSRDVQSGRGGKKTTSSGSAGGDDNAP